MNTKFNKFPTVKMPNFLICFSGWENICQQIAEEINNIEKSKKAIVESPKNSFKPFLVNYIEIIIIPSELGAYTIRPFGNSIGKKIGTIKAFLKS